MPSPLRPSPFAGKIKSLHPKVRRSPYYFKAMPSEQAAPALRLSASKTRAFTGQETPSQHKVSKLDTGKIGEAIALAYLKEQGKPHAKLLNVGEHKRNNLPLDLTDAEDTVYEVKTGLASNGEKSWHWRMSIGQPGTHESNWLASASPEAKEAHNDKKEQAILQRKQRLLDLLGQRLGKQLRGKTIALIVDPDRHLADIYLFDGFHARIGWHSDEAQQGYVTTVNYTGV